MTVHIALTPQFQRAALRLTAQQHAYVHRAILKLHDGLASVHLHALHGCPFKSFGVSPGELRVIAFQEDDTLVLLHVDAHDAAYAWAERQRLVRFGHIVRVIEAETAAGASTPPPPAPGATPAGPLAEVPVERFAELDLGPRAARVLRELPDDDALLELAAAFQPALAEALVCLATEPERWPEILAAFRAPTPPPPLAESLAATANSAAFRLVPPGEDAWAAALAAGDLTWRLFLHPAQRRIVERRSTGAVKVTGGPGTGKTVVALHRARVLAERLCPSDPRPILLTTFGRSLCEQLDADLRALLVDRPDVRARIEVATTTAVAQRLLRDAQRPADLLDAEVLETCWEAALAHESLGLPRAFYESEREHVLARWDIRDREAYWAAQRLERRTRLTRPERSQAWVVLEAFERAMADRGGGDRLALAREAVQVCAGSGAGRVASPFAAIVCDEVQDVGAAELRLLAALTRRADGEGTAPDALFLVGDGHQRIYSHPVPLLHCGIDVRGRSVRLRLNYRTTEGIRRAAVAVLQGSSESEGEVGGGAGEGYRSLLAGPPPERVRFADADAEADWIAARIGESTGSTLILARGHATLRDCQTRLRLRGLEVPVLDARTAVPAGAPAVLCTMHRAKGLEAPRVIVIERGWPMPWPGGGDPADQGLWDRREQGLMYVAISRAREWCGISERR